MTFGSNRRVAVVRAASFSVRRADAKTSLQKNGERQDNTKQHLQGHHLGLTAWHSNRN
jgi:hypothetical protein